jgi:hypothetical protein
LSLSVRLLNLVFFSSLKLFSALWHRVVTD